MFSLNMQLGYLYGAARCSVLKTVEHDLARSEVSAANIASSYNRNVSGSYWVYFKLQERRNGQRLMREEMSNMVNLLRQAGIPRRKHLS